MSLRALIGIARSLRTYRLDRAHLDGLTAFLRPLLPPDALVFDVGAHVGDRVVAARRCGARVVAVEPQPGPARVLRALHGRDRAVTIVQCALGAEPGRATMRVNRANPTVSTLSEDMVAAAPGNANWQGQRWDGATEVAIDTLDALIARHGRPDLLKIDVEGHESAVLAGLSTPVPVLSFEVTMLMRAAGLDALERAVALGYRRFRLTAGESHIWMGPEQDAEATRAQLRTLPDAINSLDVFAFADPR